MLQEYTVVAESSNGAEIAEFKVLQCSEKDAIKAAWRLLTADQQNATASLEIV